jgi:CheY-like chemotaxis protein
VLLAEDNDINQQIAVELLRGAGMEFDVASNGREAIEKLAAASVPYDVVLMDIQMPEMDGYEATRRIRAHAWGASLPIIAMTAHALDEERRKALESGMDGHITKPIDPEAMFETIKRFYRPAGTAPEAGTTAPPGSGEAPFPPIEGVDVAAALKRLAGNRRLYRDLLQRFAEGQEGIAREIEAAMEQGDADQALMLTHKLNGIAGNLGVDTVHTAAAELEKRLRDKDSRDAIREVHARLLAALSAAVLAIRSMERQEATVRDGSLPDGHPQDVNVALPKLSRLIEESDSEALEVFESLRATWERIAGREETKILADLLSSYDFAAALPHVKSFQLRLRASPGGGEADVGLE